MTFKDVPIIFCLGTVWHPLGSTSKVVVLTRGYRCHRVTFHTGRMGDKLTWVEVFVQE